MSNQDTGMVTLTNSCRGILQTCRSHLQAVPIRDQGAGCIYPHNSVVEMKIPRHSCLSSHSGKVLGKSKDRAGTEV